MFGLVAAGAAVVLPWLTYTLVRARSAGQSAQDAATVRRAVDDDDDASTQRITPLDSLIWETEKPKQLRPYKPTFHITMALKADTPQELITIDGDYLNRVALRRSLIAQHGRTVHGCTPAGAAAVREVYAYLMSEYLPQRYPTIFQLEEACDASSSQFLRNLATGARHPTTTTTSASSSAAAAASVDPEAAALRILGETVEEDLFLLRETPRGHESTAFVCCFPSGFDPAEKLGRRLREIHAPVPSYDKIALSMERFFGKLEVGKGVKRMNWSVQTHDQLFNRKGNHLGTDDFYNPDEDVDISKTFLRVELQTLRRLPKTHAILFAFKTYMYPVQQLRDERAGPDLADAIEGLGAGNAPGMGFYKGNVRWGKAVCEYLRS